MPPKRIVILGNAGSGKSTLARHLGAKLGHDVVHLDRLFWQPNWQKPEDADFRGRIAQSLQPEAWISEGNYPRTTFDLRLPRADLVIWLDTARMTCLWRVILRNRRGGQRPDLPVGCTERMNREFIEFLHYVWTFDRDYKPRIERLRQQHGPHVPVVRLQGTAQIEAFLSQF